MNLKVHSELEIHEILRTGRKSTHRNRNNNEIDTFYLNLNNKITCMGTC